METYPSDNQKNKQKKYRKQITEQLKKQTKASLWPHKLFEIQKFKKFLTVNFVSQNKHDRYI